MASIVIKNLKKQYPNGFVAIEGSQDAEFWSVMLDYEGNSLLLSGEALDPDGYVKVELVEAMTGEVLPGSSLDECIPLTGRFNCKKIAWKSGISLEDYDDCVVFLHFQLHKCRLYAFQFGAAEG